MIDRVEIENVIQHYFDPYLNKTWGEANVVKRIEWQNNQLTIDVVLGYPIAKEQAEIRRTLLVQLHQIVKDPTVIALKMSWQVQAHTVSPAIPAIPGVKNIIAIASGKGGVGKSTTAVNLALALAAEGAEVGILDADIYGPNQPQMLGQPQRLQLENGQPLPPVVAYGIQSMSMAYLIEVNTPMIWRGPMVSSALQQLARDTAWQNLDYLIIDLPPGTGDIQLTLAQKIPVTAAVIVTTPQEVAVLDARKGLEMFAKVNVPVLGIVENMSGHVCEHCGHQQAIFGSGGAKRLSQECSVELLGQVPLLQRIREQADQGQPIVVAEPDSDVAKIYHAIGLKIAAKLALLPRNYAVKFPKIVIQ